MDLLFPLLILLLFVPLLLSFRKQRRQFAEMQQLQSSLGVGDRVLTTSGMHATIVATDDDTVDLEIAPGVVTTWVRQAVRERIDETDADDALDGEYEPDAGTAGEADKR